MPSSPGCAAIANMAGPPMAEATMSGFMSLQTAPASAASVASDIMSSLDADGDGAISLAEAEANGNSNAANAFSALDANGDGSIDADELTSAVASAHQQLTSAQSDASLGVSPSHHGRHHHHSAADLASGVISGADSDGSGGLSLEEVSSVLGVSSSNAQAGFSALDANGDGTLSLTELTSAIDTYMQSRLSDQAQQARSGVSGVIA